MAVTYTVEGKLNSVDVTFTELPDSLVFLRVERREAQPDTGVAPPPPPPEPPRLTVSAEGRTVSGSLSAVVSLSWVNTPAVTLDVQRSVNGGASWSTIASNVSTGSAEDVIAADGTTDGVYQYRTLRGAVGSNVWEVTVATEPPTAPVLSVDRVRAVSGGMHDISLSWVSNASVTVDVFRSRNWQAYELVQSNVTTGSLVDRVGNGRYRYVLMYRREFLEPVEAFAGAQLTDVAISEPRMSGTSTFVTFTWDRSRPVDWWTSRESERGPGIPARNRRDVRWTPSVRPSGRGDRFLAFWVERDGVASDRVVIINTGWVEPTALNTNFAVAAVESSGQRAVTVSWDQTGNNPRTMDRRVNNGVWTQLFTSRRGRSYTETIPLEGLYEYRLRSGNWITGPASAPYVTPLPASALVLTLNTQSFIPPPPPTPPRTPLTVREFSREEVTGLMLDGEMFNLPRVYGDIVGADGDSSGWIWLAETRDDYTGTIVLRYNPVSGQGWLFTTSEVTEPSDIAVSDNQLALSQGDVIHLFTKPQTVRGDTPLGVLAKAGDVTLPAAPSGISSNLSVFYANIAGTVGSYSLLTGDLIATVAGLPTDATAGTISYGGYGLFAARRGAANPSTFWRNLTRTTWQVLQSDVEPRVTALAATDTRVYLVDRPSGVISPYSVNTPELLTAYVDRFAPLGVDLEYRVGAQGFNDDYETGEWEK